MKVGPLTLDVRARNVQVGEEQIKLSVKEYELLLALAGEPTRVFTREELLRDVWGFRSPGRTRTNTGQPREPAEEEAPRRDPARLIVNVWGVGYRLCDPALIN